MWKFYSGDFDPLIREDEVQTQEDADDYGAVECPNGCGFWRGDVLQDGCPNCGEDCHDVVIDEG